jgi:hypothetical protein
MIEISYSALLVIYIVGVITGMWIMYNNMDDGLSN